MTTRHKEESPKAARRGAERRGRVAESLAAWWLRAKGYAIVARRFRVAVGEIDLVVRRGSLLAAVEVKAHAGETNSLEAVTPRQRQRIQRALEAFLARRPDLAQHAIRFDVVIIGGGLFPRHLPDAWRP